MNRMIPTGLLVVLMVSAGCSQGKPQRARSDETVPPSDTAASPTAAPFATFADWCVNQASLTPDARHTVGVLLATAETQDCNQAEAVLTSLTGLDLGQQEIVDVMPLATLPHLTQLSLGGNQIVDVSPLASLTNLAALYLSANQIVDVSPLAHLTQLIELNLSENQIVDVSPLASLTNLTWLYLANNQIVDVSPIASLTKLKEL